MQLTAEIKIDKQNIEDILALTSMQEGMLFHYLKDPGDDHYIEQLSLRISGNIELHYFEQAWNVVIAANEMLRTVFRWEKLSF
ncbi:MAG TPA: condensation domain-containing protein, partial [Candidatus Kapabacteria bacterium]|nr:condensation domain-containing protein [Candidatus Kapabacteria bacterium]